MPIPLPEAAFRYSAFISYSHSDERWARWLQGALETYRVPSHLSRPEGSTASRRLAPVFRDRSDLPSSTDLGARIREALQGSASLLVVCSPGASASRWVDEEIRYFRSLGRGDRIFCLIVDGEPNASDLPGRESQECFAPALRFLDGADGPSTGPRLEPIAADVRSGADGKSNARLKILAGLLGVGLDVLKQRELRRRNRRLALVTAAALVLTVVMTTLAIEARIARRAAEDRQKQAEGLVAFMLTDLNDRLRQVQRLDILEAVDNEAMAYFLALPVRDVTDQTLALRAKALQKIGNVRQDQGQLPAALESYRAAADLGAELLRRSPDEPERKAAYAETLNHVGNAQYFQGDRDRALESFSRAADLLAQAMATQPTDQGLAALNSALTNAGRVLETRGEFDAAKSRYEAALETAVVQAARQPDAARPQIDLAEAHESLGKIALELGRLGPAIAAYRDVRRIKAEVWARRPDDRDALERLLVSNAILGRTLALCGDDVAAAKFVREAVSQARTLVAFDAKQVDWRRWLGKYSVLLGSLARSAGRLPEAVGHDAEAQRILGALVETDRTNRAWQRELTAAQVESAHIRLAQGDPAQAARLVKASLETIGKEREAGRTDRNLRLLEAQAYLVLGQVARSRSDPAGARGEWNRAKEAIAKDVQVGANPNLLSTWASALLLLEEATAARPTIDRLAAMGYHATDFVTLLAARKEFYGAEPLAQRCGRD